MAPGPVVTTQLDKKKKKKIEHVGQALEGKAFTCLKMLLPRTTRRRNCHDLCNYDSSMYCTYFRPPYEPYIGAILIN